MVEAKSLPDLQVRRFPEIHFVMPEEVYTKDHLRALSDLWMGTSNSIDPYPFPSASRAVRAVLQ